MKNPSSKREESSGAIHPLAQSIASSALTKGYDFFVNVPCGILAPLISAIDASARDAGYRHVYAPREDSAVGLACGAYFAGRQPLVMMQNSGLGQSINALASLTQPFRVPLTLLVSLRGHIASDSEENLLMGKLTAPILHGLGIETRTLGSASYEEDIVWAKSSFASGRSAALLVEPDLMGWSAST